VLAQIEANPGDTATITETAAEAVQIGTGYFWILRANPDSDEQYDFGITDESAKLNINTASQAQLLAFPGMTEEAATAISDWHSRNASSATDMVYSSLADPYVAKHDDFETVEELALVDSVTPEMLYGSDRNRDGVVDDAERSNTNLGSMFSGGISTERGLVHYLTAYTSEPNTRTNVNTNNAGRVRTALTNAGISTQRANQIVNAWQSVRNGPRNSQNFRGFDDFFRRAGLQSQDLRFVLGKFGTSNNVRRGLINVNTASREVLMALPRLQESDADRLVSYRDGADTSSLAWVYDALGDVNKVLNIADSITSQSYQYSADIVAVSGDGRGYKRVRIVVDSQQAPAKIVYRKDLTSLGWPLPADVRTSLRQGRGVVTGYARTVGTSGRINF
jgi:DNA uptake protein ComE-like DNA-binding protein